MCWMDIAIFIYLKYALFGVNVQIITYFCTSFENYNTKQNIL